MPETRAMLCCPHCGSPFVRQTRPKAPNEYLLRLIQRYPFQCQVCAHRFKVSQAGLWKAGEARDRRHFDRLVTSITVTLSDEEGKEAGGLATDLSLAGCQLQTRAQVVVGAPLRVVLHPTHTDCPLVVERAVVRSVYPPTVGVQFVQFATGDRSRLSQLVRTLLIEQRASA